MAVTIGQLIDLNRLNEESEWENSSNSDEDEPSEIDEPRSEGYDFEFVNKLSSEHKCPICLLAMRNPVQTADCGHRFCEDCLLNAFRKRRSRVCPQDRNPIPKREGYFRDLAWERVILSLRVKCKQKRKGCKWTGELRQYKVHEGKDCAKFPLECPKKCGMNKIPREKVKSHVLQNCPMTMVGCVYKEAGCTLKVKRKDLAAHLKQATEYHLEKTWEELRKTKQKVELLEKKQKEQNRTIGMVKEWKKRMNGMQTRLDAMERNARDQKRACEVSFEKKRKMKRMCYSDDDDSSD